MTARKLPSILFLALIGGCAQPRTAAPKAATVQFPVIVRLVGRNQTITITSGPHGPLYSASSRGGELIVQNATLEQLRSEHPQLYRQIAPATADAQGNIILAAD